MNLQQIDVTGCRIVGAITRELSHAGPKHHGIVLGKSYLDNEVYIAEAGYPDKCGDAVRLSGLGRQKRKLA